MEPSSSSSRLQRETSSIQWCSTHRLEKPLDVSVGAKIIFTVSPCHSSLYICLTYIFTFNSSIYSLGLNTWHICAWQKYTNQLLKRFRIKHKKSNMKSKYWKQWLPFIVSCPLAKCWASPPVKFSFTSVSKWVSDRIVHVFLCPEEWAQHLAHVLCSICSYWQLFIRRVKK